MNGILIIDKPVKMTSFDVLKKIKRKLNIKKIGHAGTLDSMATGVLVVLINQATKLSDYFLNDDKEYLCEISVGEATTTEDLEGEIIEKVKVSNLDAVDEVLKSLLGKLLQVPPMFSAVHYQGKKLYELAREGKVVARKPREVFIHDLKRVSDIQYKDEKASFFFQAKVSKGTYLRTLCVEIGKRLGYPAHMKSLRRLSSGKFNLDMAYTLEDIENDNFHLIRMLDALNHYQIIEVDNYLAPKISNGQKIKLQSDNNLVVISYQNKLLAIYERKENYYRAKRIWK